MKRYNDMWLPQELATTRGTTVFVWKNNNARECVCAEYPAGTVRAHQRRWMPRDVQPLRTYSLHCYYGIVRVPPDFDEFFGIEQ